MAAGLAGGLIVGVAATGIFTTVTGNTKEKEYQDKITSLGKRVEKCTERRGRNRDGSGSDGAD